MKKRKLLLGFDVGSTSVKTAVIDADTGSLLHTSYKRHNLRQVECLLTMTEELRRTFPDAADGATTEVSAVFCGSGGGGIAERLGVPHIQEVFANSLAIQEYYPRTRTAIELGGQDAKIIFFSTDENDGRVKADDMRMNGVCAGGTGAFIDQIAELLHISPEQFNSFAKKGSRVYEISGRCGVFAKTDIQPLLNQGAAREDIALSCFHAIVKQTIGGLAQGRDIRAPLLLQGGPIVFNPVLAKVFGTRLGLSGKDVTIPEQKEVFIALGAALSLTSYFAGKREFVSLEILMDLLLKEKDRIKDSSLSAVPLFESQWDYAVFKARHSASGFEPAGVKKSRQYSPGFTIDGYLGLDVGSTTTKFVLINREEEVIHRFYRNNDGDPLTVLKQGLASMYRNFRDRRLHLNVLGAGATGYGGDMAAAGYGADYKTVETVAHAEASLHLNPEVSFILDVGGQDMKAIYLGDGIITNIVVNEACSAGCGSFIETFAKSMGVVPEQIARLALTSTAPARLGSRCTVFMNSSIISAQKNGKSDADILAGICRSVIDNIFTKVLRVTNMNALGPVILVQGGTFKNDGVLRAFEQYIGKPVLRPEHPEEMGAYGTALLTKKAIEEQVRKKGFYHSGFHPLESIDSLTFTRESGIACPFCPNTCLRTVLKFGNGRYFITGNKCPKGEVLSDKFDLRGKLKLSAIIHKTESVPDLLRTQVRLLFKDYPVEKISRERNIRIGLPRNLEFWESMPFWRSLFKALGFTVVVSPGSSTELYEKGLGMVPSDTVCFPAKLGHGHIRALADAGVDRIFMPMMIRMPKENRTATGTHMCSIVQGYPLVIEKSDDPKKRYGIPFDTPAFHWENEKLKVRQTIDYVNGTFGIPRMEVFRAIKEADKAFLSYKKELLGEGRKVLDSLGRTYPFAVVIAGRPYHADELVNHTVSALFTRMGIPVMVLESLPNLHSQNLAGVRVETTIPFHTRMLGGTFCVAKNPALELVQIVSFGCGHDAILSDEMARILRESGSRKEMLILKLDETDIQGPLKLRVRSFVETVELKRKKFNPDLEKSKYRELKSAFSVRFDRKDKREKTVLAPNLSPGFSRVISEAMKREGFTMFQMPLANERAIELGKKYVHNDMCYPSQINIGEALALLEGGEFKPDQVALGLAKNCDDCRAGQYAVIARKALDEAGYPEVPIMTSGSDTKRMHPGARFGIRFQLNMVWGLCFLDGLEMMRRRLRPFEANHGSADALFDGWLGKISEMVVRSRKKALKLCADAVADFNALPLRQAGPGTRPKIGIVGEILVNYHPGSNRHIERYLEDNDMEVIIPPLLDFFRRGYVIDKNKAIRRLVPHPVLTWFGSSIPNDIIGFVKSKVAGVLGNFSYYAPSASIRSLVRNIQDLIDVSYIVGEGWLLPAEIIQMIRDGVSSVIIVQPFGCLPNHITGRGMIKAIKSINPQVQILSLDYEPDTSMANIENRLQLLIMHAKERFAEKEKYSPFSAPLRAEGTPAAAGNREAKPLKKQGDVSAHVS